MLDSQKETYRTAGVDLAAAARAKELIKPLARSTSRPGVIGEIGFFGGLFEAPQGYDDPVLVSSTDSVGTKVKLAVQMGRLDTIGVDIVNHCVNDIFVSGAEPLFFLDYIGIGELVPEQAEQIVKGVASACIEAGCALIGGELAQMPALYQKGDFDLVGFVVGVVERSRMIDGSTVQAGDVLLGVPSSGLHTNGYSLARRVLRTEEDPAVLEGVSPELGRSLGDALLEPHRAYYPMLKLALPHLKAMAHITGGGFTGNIPRVLPEDMAVEIERSSWVVPPLFLMIQEAGGVGQADMDQVFNQGIGMVLIASAEQAVAVKRQVSEAFEIGRVVPWRGQDQVTLV